jgi:hypothetical protein
MSDLKKLYDSISKIEEQSTIFESNINTIGKIANIKDSIDQNLKTIESLNKSFKESKNEFSIEVKNINSKVEEIKKTSFDGFENVVKANGVLTRDIKEHTESKFDNSNNIIQGFVRAEVDNLSKIIQNDLTLKFDQNKKDLSDFFKDISNQLTKENSELKEKVNIIEQKNNLNKILLIVSICTSTILSLAIIFISKK